MRYPIVIEPATDSTAFGVVVPDLEGCFSAGDSIDEAISNAAEAIELYLEQAIHDSGTIPKAKTIDEHIKNPDYQGWTWAFVETDISKLQSISKRFNITAPERVMQMVDIAAHSAGENRSEFLTKAAVMRIEHQFNHDFPTTLAANDITELKITA